jgi:MtN3 and saliva related transmembrane protein
VKTALRFRRFCKLNMKLYVFPGCTTRFPELTQLLLPTRTLMKGKMITMVCQFNKMAIVLLLSPIVLYGCRDLIPHDAPSLLDPKIRRSEIVGLVAGFGTTFAALPDLIAMLKLRSSAGMNPRMAAIMGAFQILWVYYGLLIASRPVIMWNVVAILVNFLSVGAYRHFVRKEKQNAKG